MDRRLQGVAGEGGGGVKANLAIEATAVKADSRGSQPVAEV